MKRIFRFCIVPVLVLAMMISSCIIAPLTASAENYISSDWTAADASQAIVQDGDLEKGYNVTTMGNYVRLNEKIDPIKGVTFKAECGIDYWYSITFEAEATGTPGFGNVEYLKKVYMFYPQADNKLLVHYWENNTIVMQSMIDFDLSVEHTYGFALGGDNYYRLVIDGTSPIEVSFAADEMSSLVQNGAYVSLGSTNVAKMIDFRVKGYNWTTAHTTVDGNIEDGYSINVTNAAEWNFARLNKQVDILSGISFQYMPLQGNGEWLQVKFAAAADTSLGNEVTSATTASFFFRVSAIDTSTGIGTLSVRLYNGGEPEIASISNFDFNAVHSFDFRLHGENYVFCVDDKFACYAHQFSAADIATINNNGAGAYVVLGGPAHAAFTNVKPNPASDWTIKPECSVEGDFENGYSLSTASWKFARLNKQIDVLSGIKFQYTPLGSSWVQLNFSSTADVIDLAQSETNFFLGCGDYDSSTGLGTLNVSIYSSSRPNQNIGKIEKFNFNEEHIYNFMKGGDGYYRLYIDGFSVCDSGTSNPHAISESDMLATNNNGAGAYVTLGGEAPATFTNIKIVPWTTTNYSVNENGGYDISSSSSVRYNKPVDMEKGIMYKLSYSGSWAGITFESTRTSTIGGLNTGDGLRMYTAYLHEDRFQANLWLGDGNLAVGNAELSIDNTGYIHIQYKLNNEGTHYYLTVNGQGALDQDAISVEEWANKFNNGMMYVSFTPWEGTINVSDFREYSAPAINTNYAVANGMIYGVAANTNVADLAVEAVGGEIRVYNAEGVRVESGNVATGMTVCDFINTNDKTDAYTISVSGDTDCDGTATASDMIIVRKAIIGIDELSGAVEKAADMDNSGGIDIIDLIKIKKNIALNS